MLIGRLVPGDDLHRYRRASAWLLGDVVRFAPGRMAAVATLDGVSLAVTGLIFATVIQYVRHAQLGQPVEFAGQSIPTGNPGSLLILIGFVVVAGLGATAFALASGLMAKRVARAWHVHVLRRSLALARAPDVAGRLARASSVQERPVTLAEMPRAAKCAAFAVDRLVSALLPTLLATLAIAALVWTDARMTALLLIVLPVFLVPLALCYRRVALNQRLYQRMSRLVSPRVRRRFELLEQTSLPVPATDDVIDAPEHVQMLDGLYGRRIVPVLVRGLNSAFVIIVVAIILANATRVAAWGSVDWARLIAYLVLLRFAAAGVMRSTMALTTANRMFDSYEMLSLLFGKSKGDDATPASPRVMLDAAPCLLLSSMSTGALRQTLGARDVERGRTVIHDRLIPQTGMTPLAHFAGPNPTRRDRERLAALLERLAVVGALDECGLTIDTPIERSHVARMSPELALILTTAYVMNQPRTLVLQSLSDVHRADPAFRAAWLEALATHAVVLFDTGTRRYLSPASDDLRRTVPVVHVMDETTHETGDAAWLEANRQRIDRKLAAAAAETPLHDADDEDDDE